MDKEPLKKARFKAVVFDLGNVLFSFDSRKISAYISRKCGFPAVEVHGFVFGTELERSIDLGKITLEDLLDSVNKRFSCAIGIDEFRPVWCDMFTPIEGMESLVENLKKSGYRLGMLSNTNKPHFDFIKAKFPLAGRFDDYHLSYETGLLKPERRAFERLMAYYDCAPSDIFFTDDIEVNVKAAAECGIKAVVFESRAKLVSDLSAFGIEFK